MYKVAIKKNETGEIRLCKQELPWNDDESWWTEGNMSCDCNRASEFAKAGGEKEQAFPCGDTAYSALHKELENGERVQLDE